MIQRVSTVVKNPDYLAGCSKALTEILATDGENDGADVEETCDVCGAEPYTIEHHGDHYREACWDKRNQ